MALTEAKGKIDKMKATPQVLESLNDVSYFIWIKLSIGWQKEKVLESWEQTFEREFEKNERQC